MRGVSPYSSAASRRRRLLRDATAARTASCPTEHRTWGQNLEQPWVEEAWAQGYGAAYGRMLEEADGAWVPTA